MYLITGGCSFTTSNFKSIQFPDYDCNFSKWPELIQGNWSKVINTGRSGTSNKEIIQKVTEQVLLRSDISTVVIAFTDWYRYPMPDGITINPAWTLRNHTDYTGDMLVLYKKLQRYEEIFPTGYKSIRRQIADMLISLYALIELCVAKGIAFVGFQMLDFNGISPVQKFNDYIQQTFISHKVFHAIDRLQSKGSIQMLNWPFINNLSTSLDTYMWNATRLANHNKYYYRIGPKDPHPNKFGQVFFSEWIMQNAEL